MINAYNNSKSNVFVKEIKLNGVNIDLVTSPFLRHTGKSHTSSLFVQMIICYLQTLFLGEHWSSG